jgi:rare lipoprotein A
MACLTLRPVLVLVCDAFLMSNASAELGRASWYALTTPTASGERCNPNALTAAHPTLPFGTIVEVKNLRNGRSVFVRINDRGPFVQNRIIDLTRAAAARLGFLKDGLAMVRLNVFSISSAHAAPPRDVLPAAYAELRGSI